jgi:hypothetical protein
MMSKSYSELLTLPTFEERFEYLKLNGQVGEMTFNGHRYLNQKLYSLPEWKSVRRQVIIRDEGYDLGMEGYEINGPILVHHINPITIADIIYGRHCVLDLENLISTSHNTHNAIHYGDKDLLQKEPVVRKKNDTCLWR